MIKISIPSGFLQERAYALHVLCYEILGLKYALEVKENSDTYTLEFQNKHIRIKDLFFSRFTQSSYLAQHNIPDTATQSRETGLDSIIIIYGEDTLRQTEEGIETGVDFIAGTFFMLTRWEEYVDQTRDHHDRFPAHASLAVRAGFLNRPVVNEYAALLKSWLIEIGLPETAVRTRLPKISIHCDVDTALYWPSRFSILRKVAFQLFRQKSISGARKEIRAYLDYSASGHDPYDTYDHLMDIAESRQTQATFCFLVSKRHALDSKQILKSPHVKKNFDRIRKRGHQAGIHFSYLTPEDEGLMLTEVQQFQTDTGSTPNISRQHYLRCSTPKTWRQWEHAGINTDASMGYPEQPGFRCGICTPFPLFDFEQRRILHVIERPLIAMDVTFHQYLRNTPDQTIQYCRQLWKTIQKYDGEFVLLWHNSSFGMEWEGWQDVLRLIVKEH